MNGLRKTDWSEWTPAEKATLLFVIRDGRILLIHKKTGLGKGKINGPGGRIQPGELPIEAAIREVQEELLITPLDVQHAGTLRFAFADGYTLLGEVFKASDYKGVPTETNEAKPIWADVDSIPYEQMWSDDSLWMPLLLEGRKFHASFLYDGDTMLDSIVEEVSA